MAAAHPLNIGLTLSSFPINPQDGATLHTSNITKAFSHEVFGARVMSGNRIEGMDWPPSSPDLTACDYWLHGYLKVAKFNLHLHL